MESTNPAERLYQIIISSKKLPATMTCEQGWKQVLNVKGDDTSLMLKRYGQVITLPQEVREQVSLIPGIRAERVLRWVPKVEAAFRILNFQMKWDQFLQRMDEAVVVGTEMCSELLNKHQPEKVIDQSKLTDLQEQVEKLMQDVQEGSLSADVEKFIISRLTEIGTALEEYSIKGSAPLEIALESTVGKSVLNQSLAKEVRKTPSGTKLWSILAKIALVLGIAKSLTELSEFAIPVLPIFNTDIETGDPKLDEESEVPAIEVPNVDV